MTKRNVMKLLMFGAAIILIATINVTADEEDPIHKITTVIVENLDEPLISPTSVTIDHDASKGERGDIDVSKEPENDDLIIDENLEEGNLISPNQETIGITKNIDTADQMLLDNGSESTSSLLSFPVVFLGLSIGLLGCIFVYGKRQ